MFEPLEPEYPKKFYLTKFDLVFYLFTLNSGVPSTLLSLKSNSQLNFSSILNCIFSSSWSCTFISLLLLGLVVSFFGTAQIIFYWKNTIPMLTISREGFQIWHLFVRLRTFRWDEVNGIKSKHKKAVVFVLREEALAKRYLEDRSKFKYIYSILGFRKKTITVVRPSIIKSNKKALEKLLKSYNDYLEEQEATNKGVLNKGENIAP